MTLNFRISNQTLKQIGETKPANHSQEYLELSFEFLTTDWTGLTKFGLFTNQQGLKYRVALTNDKVIVPNSCLADEKFLFSIYGVLDDVRITTNQLTIYLKDSGYVRDVENDIPDDDPTIVEEIYEALDTKVNTSDIVNNLESFDIHKPLSANMGLELNTAINGKADESFVEVSLEGKSDVGHTHTKSDITDFSHNHDERYYTESEVDLIVENLKNEMNNKVILKGDKPIIQTGDTMDFTAYAVQDGMPVVNEKVYFYIKED